MDTIIHTCIVVPCFNEALNLPVEEYEGFLRQHRDVLLCFVNDGSTDETQTVLSGLQERHPANVVVLSLDRNQGKAAAVRHGVLFCNANYQHKYLAFLDADLSTALEECLRVGRHLQDGIQFAFGSRIMRIGSVIERRRFRFLVGRVVATFISISLDLKVYDTQCGCKVFTKALSEYLFEEAFLSRWLFDVELFFRMLVRYGKANAVAQMLEVPLLMWADRGKSKVRVTYFFRLWLDLWRIRRKYRKRISKA